MVDLFRQFAVVSYKGGVGKTTTAIHLAYYLSRKGKTVIIDGDLNQSALDWARTGKLPFAVISARRVPPNLSEKYHFVVVDTQARPQPEEIEALIQYTYLIVPTTCDALSLRPTLTMLRDFDTHRDTWYGMHYRILLTMVPPPPSEQGAAARATLEDLHTPLFKSSIRRFTAFQKAALYGLTVDQIKDDKYSKIAWNCYTQAWSELPIQMPAKEKRS